MLARPLDLRPWPQLDRGGDLGGFLWRVVSLRRSSCVLRTFSARWCADRILHRKYNVVESGGEEGEGEECWRQKRERERGE